MGERGDPFLIILYSQPITAITHMCIFSKYSAMRMHFIASKHRHFLLGRQDFEALHWWGSSVSVKKLYF